MKVDKCPSTLKTGFETYSSAALRRLFNSKQVSHVLPFDPPEKDKEVQHKFQENRQRISISGVQKKLSLVLEGKNLRLSNEGETGQYILKPISDDNDLIAKEFIPANEHLTMQIARQIFGIETAENAMIFFKDGQHAYLTKRFDLIDANKKYGMEDFASLTGKTSENAGADFKYTGSYEDMFKVLREKTALYKILAPGLFRLVLFNYLFSNGDAHLKNFSLLETELGDYKLSPAYDLMNTRIHLQNEASDLAMRDGLFSDDFYTESFEALGYYAYDDFLKLAEKVGIKESLVKANLELAIEAESATLKLIDSSFLDEVMKHNYKATFLDKKKRLKNSYGKGKI